MLLSYAANPKDTFDNCSICEAKAILVLIHLLIDGSKEVCESNTANGISIDAHVHHEI